MVTYLFDQFFDPVPQLILALGALDRREGLVDALGGRAPHVGQQVRQVLGALQLNLPLVRRYRCVHGPSRILEKGAKEREKKKVRSAGGDRSAAVKCKCTWREMLSQCLLAPRRLSVIELGPCVPVARTGKMHEWGHDLTLAPNTPSSLTPTNQHDISINPIVQHIDRHLSIDVAQLVILLEFPRVPVASPDGI